MNVRSRDGTERFVILASDGLWDTMTSDEAVQIVQAALQDQASRRAATTATTSAAPGLISSLEGPSSNAHDEAARRLVRVALEREAASAQLSLRQLLELPAGSSSSNSRRNFHDDITVVIVPLEPLTSSESAADSSTGGLLGWLFGGSRT